MLLSAVSVLVVVQSSSEIPEGLTNNPVCLCIGILLALTYEHGIPSANLGTLCTILQ